MISLDLLGLNPISIQKSEGSFYSLTYLTSSELLMKLRFYFDYSDYRSYLMMHTLQSVQDLPGQFQWIALDAYSLRALTGYSSHADCSMEHDYRRQEAIRFCQREGLEFVWQNDRFHNGSALHVGIWLMIHQNALFEQFSQKVLEILWGLGNTVDSNALKTILSMLDVNFDDLMKSSSERESFQIQDNCLQQAMADGVFDVPAVVIGDQVVCHFDQAAEIRRLMMIEFFREMSFDAVCSELANLMLSMPHDVCRHKFDLIVRKNGTQQQTMPALDQGFITIQHSLSAPYAVWHVPKLPLLNELPCHICTPQNDIQHLIHQAADHAINLCPCAEFEWTDNEQITTNANCADFMLFVGVRYQHEKATLCIHPQNGKLQTKLLLRQDFHTEVFHGWKIAIFSPKASRDINMARLAAHNGCHLLITNGTPSPLPEAFGFLASSWVISILDNKILVTDSESQHTEFKPEGSYSLSTTFKHSKANSWNSPTPRTLLLCEKSLTFGELSAKADIELASLGMNLFVKTAQQASELSPTRVFEKFRIQSDMILLLPFNNEQIFVPELISHRLVETLNQAPKEAYPIFVNYWSDLEFEMLDDMRPALAALVMQFKIPLILVVGNQVTEIWLSTPQGTAWRVEKDDDCYTIDVDELVQTGQCFEMLLKTLGISEAEFINRLQQIETIAKKQS